MTPILARPLLLAAACLLAPAAACTRARTDTPPAESAAAASSTTTPTSTTAGAMRDIYWKLTELDGQPIVPAPASPREPHLRLLTENSRASGATGCNTFFGPYTLDGDRIRLERLATTRMACLDPALNRQEQAYLAALTSADRAAATGDSLTLYQGERVVARFVAVAGK